MFTEVEEKQIRRVVRYIAFGIPLALVILGLANCSFHKLFYTETKARVLYVESKIIGVTATQYATSGVRATVVEVEYTDREGYKYTAKLPTINGEFLRAGDVISVMYKNSNHGKCKLK